MIHKLLSSLLFQGYQPTASKTATILPAKNSEIKNPEFSRNLRSSTVSGQSQQQIENCVDYALNGRRLRQRVLSTDKLMPPASNISLPASTSKQSPSVYASGSCGNCNASVPNSPSKNSPVKQNAPNISMDDLKSSVNMYFGAANRIASGEKFIVKAKRKGPNGQFQYLIEWEGLNT